MDGYEDVAPTKPEYRRYYASISFTEIDDDILIDLITLLRTRYGLSFSIFIDDQEDQEDV